VSYANNLEKRQNEAGQKKTPNNAIRVTSIRGESGSRYSSQGGKTTSTLPKNRYLRRRRVQGPGKTHGSDRARNSGKKARVIRWSRRKKVLGMSTQVAVRNKSYRSSQEGLVWGWKGTNFCVR